MRDHRGITNINDKIHVWVPDLLSTTGGIQTFSRHFLEALGKEVSPRGSAFFSRMIRRTLSIVMTDFVM